MHSNSSRSCLCPGSSAIAGAATVMTTAPASSALRMRRRTRITRFPSPWCKSDELEDEPDEGEGLGERDAEEHGRTDRSLHLGLPRHRLDGVADDQTDADTRADGREAVPHRAECALEVTGHAGAIGCGDDLDHAPHVFLLPSWSSDRTISARDGWTRRCTPRSES